MSDKELRRGEVLGRVKRGELKLTEAAQLLEISYRQTKRMWRRYATGGTKGLRHGNVGRCEGRACSENLQFERTRNLPEHPLMTFPGRANVKAP